MRLNNRRNTINSPKVVSAYSHLKQINAQKKKSRKTEKSNELYIEMESSNSLTGGSIIAEKKLNKIIAYTKNLN